MNYLYLLALCLAFISCCSAAAAYGKTNGQPGCRTEEEISVGSYPHFHNKKQYWVCETLGVPARIAFCPVETAFLTAERICVPWAEWYWSPTVLPPSQPAYGGI
ncbi:hypothetical protein ACLKA6_004133 [Drosophila palustris]